MKTVLNVATGEVTQVPLTPEEIAAADAATAAEQGRMAPILAQQQALAAARAEAQADNIVQYLRDHTPLECEQYVENNTATLAATRALLEKMAMVLCVLAKESL
mgnify:CR=1 FL=1